MSAPTLAGANTYHASRLGKEAWEGETSEKRARALQSAIDDMAPYARASNYEASVYEQALWLLSDEADFSRDGVASISVGGVSKSYDRSSKRPSHISLKAWMLIIKGKGGATAKGAIREQQQLPVRIPPYGVERRCR